MILSRLRITKGVLMILAFGFFFWTADGFAQSNMPRAGKSRWGARITTRYTGSYLNPDDAFRRSAWRTTALITFRAPPKMLFQGVLGFNQTLEPRQEFNLINPEFRMFYRLWDHPKGWMWMVGPTLALPLSRDAQDESLIFALGASSRLIWSGQKADGGLLLLYDFGLNRNFHQYQTALSGVPNSQLTLDHLIYGEYLIGTSGVRIATFGGFSSAWTYLGTINNAYVLGGEVVYNFIPELEVAVGHENGGNFLSPSGQDYNFGLFTASDARFYVSLTWML